MALSAERHDEVEALLQRIYEDPTALADELDTAVGVNGRSYSGQMARLTLGQLVLLRQALQQDENEQRFREAISRWPG